MQVSSNAYRVVGLFPFVTAEMVTRTKDELLLIKSAGGFVSEADWDSAVAAEAEATLRAAAKAQEESEETAAEKAYEAALEALRARQAEETRQRLLRVEEERRAEEARFAAELQALQTQHPAAQRLLLSGAAARDPGAYIDATLQASRIAQQAASAAGKAPLPSAAQQAVVDTMLATGGGAAAVAAGIAAELALPPQAPGALVQTAFQASSGHVVIRLAAAASIAKARGMTPEDRAKDKAAELEAKKLKQKRKQAVGVLPTKSGARVKAAQVEQLKEQAKKAAEDAASKATAAQERKRKREDKDEGARKLGRAMLRAPAVQASRAGGDGEAFRNQLVKLTNEQKMAIITLVDPGAMPKEKKKDELNKAIQQLAYARFPLQIPDEDADSDSAHPIHRALHRDNSLHRPGLRIQPAWGSNWAAEIPPVGSAGALRPRTRLRACQPSSVHCWYASVRSLRATGRLRGRARA